jgi:Replication-relaxation
MTTRRQRITPGAVDRVAQQLTPRDEQLVQELGRLRVATSLHLERLLFSELTGIHRDRTRRRVLARLVGLGVLTALERRIGGIRAGSTGLVFALDVLGQRVLRQLEASTGRPRPRHPNTPTDRFLRHSLAVTELYVGLQEAVRSTDVALDRYEAEPACWWQDSTGTWIKPDAALTISTANIEDHWAVEVDLATESLPTLSRKLRTYVSLYERGETDDSGMLPRVLLTVPSEHRYDKARGLIQQLPVAARDLFRVARFENAVPLILGGIQE